MTDHMQPLGTPDPGTLELKGDDDLLKGLAMVRALDLLIRERPAHKP